MWCCKSRKQIFNFEYGTMVKAKDPYRAYEILSSVSIKKDVQVEESETNNKWIVHFDPNVFIELKAQDQVQARRAAEWFLYLDRRELNIVRSLS